MEIIITENRGETRVVIECARTNADILRLKAHIERFDSRLAATNGEERVFVDTTDILYFETVDERTFLYTENAVLDVKLRLYEIEEKLSSGGFLRISKSVVVNLNRVKSLRPQLNRTILATLDNGERLIISRSYAKRLRDILEI